MFHKTTLDNINLEDSIDSFLHVHTHNSSGIPKEASEKGMNLDKSDSPARGQKSKWDEHIISDHMIQWRVESLKAVKRLPEVCLVEIGRNHLWFCPFF